MSIWVDLPAREGSSVGISDGSYWATIGYLRHSNCLDPSGSDDSVETMEQYGWGLIAPSILSKWSE